MEHADSNKRLLSDEAAAYLRERHGLPISNKTLRNRRYMGTDPERSYFGSRPLYTIAALDAWAERMLQAHPVAQRAA